MSPYGEVWRFTRERLAQALEGLTPAQLVWRPHPGACSIGEMTYHMAGSEVWFSDRLGPQPPVLTPYSERIEARVRARFITDAPFPFEDADMTPDRLKTALEFSGDRFRPIVDAPTPEMLERPVETPLGATVPGVAGLWRVVQHPAYHTGQIWVYRQDPEFPAS